MPKANPKIMLEPDSLDLKILEQLIKDGSAQNKQLARAVGADQRTVAKHIHEMKKSGALRITAEINWALLGVEISAYVGSTTALGEDDVERLYEFIRHEPRVVEAYSTVGSNEYFMRVLDIDLRTLREEVLRKLEPLTADLSTSIVSSQIKPKDFSDFLVFLRERQEKAQTHSSQ